MTDFPSIGPLINKFEELAKQQSSEASPGTGEPSSINTKKGTSFGIKNVQPKPPARSSGIRAKGAQPLVLGTISSVGNKTSNESPVLQGDEPKQVASEMKNEAPNAPAGAAIESVVLNQFRNFLIWQY